MPHSLGKISPWLILSICIGCGGAVDPNLPQVVPVTGKVTLDGEPLANATVTFLPQGNTPGSGISGITGTDGSYKLSTLHVGEGAPAGSYKVVLSKLVNPDGSDFVATAESDPMSSPAKERISPKYSDVEKTTLVGQVPATGAALDFVLKSKP